MARWEPGTKQRLQAAALDLYLTRGFEDTTVAEIAASVGVTERTFFRHFTDKREVLFDGQDELARAFLAGVASAAPGAAPVEVVESALQSAAPFFADDRRPWSLRRQQVITANPGLQERELLKLAALAASVAAAMRRRGIAEPSATLAAQSALTVFGVAFEQWVADGEDRSFGQLQREVLAEWTGLAGPDRRARDRDAAR